MPNTYHQEMTNEHIFFQVPLNIILPKYYTYSSLYAFNSFFRFQNALTIFKQYPRDIYSTVFTKNCILNLKKIRTPYAYKYILSQYIYTVHVQRTSSI